MTINATLINYLLICQRKMWLHHHAIRMEHTSDVVAEGRLIGEESYPQRANKNQEMMVSADFEGLTLTAKIDFFDAKNGIVHETKKSAAKEKAHTAQVQFYMYVLRKNGVDVREGIIEYPKLRETEQVVLDTEDEATVEAWIREASTVLKSEVCPPKLPISNCRHCSYFEFCWVEEQ
jgi:CRISPR-associated exonuclease Cas4